VRCPSARALARRWVTAGRPSRISGFRVVKDDFAGVLRVVMRRGDGAGRRLVAFLQQP